MISYEEFEDITSKVLKRDISSNKQQEKAILDFLLLFFYGLI